MDKTSFWASRRACHESIPCIAARFLWNPSAFTGQAQDSYSSSLYGVPIATVTSILSPLGFMASKTLSAIYFLLSIRRLLTSDFGADKISEAFLTVPAPKGRQQALVMSGFHDDSASNEITNRAIQMINRNKCRTSLLVRTPGIKSKRGPRYCSFF